MYAVIPWSIKFGIVKWFTYYMEIFIKYRNFYFIDFKVPATSFCSLIGWACWSIQCLIPGFFIVCRFNHSEPLSTVDPIRERECRRLWCLARFPPMFWHSDRNHRIAHTGCTCHSASRYPSTIWNLPCSPPCRRRYLRSRRWCTWVLHQASKTAFVQW